MSTQVTRAGEYPRWLDGSLYELYHEVADAMIPMALPILHEFLQKARSQTGVLLTLKSIAEGLMEPAMGWHRVSRALIEMAGADREFSGVSLRRFAAKIPEPVLEPATTTSTLFVAAEWAKVIRDYRLDRVADPEEARTRFALACDEGRFGDVAVAWRAVQAISPTSPSFVEALQDARVTWLDSFFRTHSELCASIKGAA